MSESPSEALLAARRALEGVQSLEITQDWIWYAQVQRWGLRCRLRPGVEGSEFIPAESDWYVLAEASYPWGTIACHPAKEGGIIHTFPHQAYNSIGDPTLPWRNGHICLDPAVGALGRNAYGSEPFAVHRRLRWRLERALAWLRAAAHGELVLSDEPFERPQFPRETSPVFTVAYTEDTVSYARWNATPERSGLVDLSESTSGVIITRCFRRSGGRPIWTPPWGSVVEARTSTLRGVWLRLSEPPVLPPWQAPITWGELRAACRRQDVDLDELLQPLMPTLRDRRRHLFLIGYPLSELSGGPMIQMRWEALLLPHLASGTETAPGFRPNAIGQQRLDRTTVLGNDVHLEWQAAENWAAQEITTRGHLQVPLTAASIAIIGIGALGSVVAELLIRAGCTHLTVVDGDNVVVGNLVRHTLTLDDIGMAKASAVVRRLNNITPHASLTAIDTYFPPMDEANRVRLQHCDIIVDCTGSDEVLFALEKFPWESPRLFFSLSLSLQARRLYCFSVDRDKFPHSAFRVLVNSWIARDLEEHAGWKLPREGIGCWHPVFPARFDDIMLMAASAVKYIETTAINRPSAPTMTVFEQLDNNDFIGLRRYIEVLGE